MNRETIAVICNNIEVDLPSGYNVAMQFYETLSHKYDITIVVPLDSDIYSYEVSQISAHVRLIPVYPSAGFTDKLYSKYAKEQLRFQFHAHEDEHIREQMIAAVGNANIIICNSVYFVYFARQVFPNKTIVYRELDIEYDKVCQKHLATPLSYNESLEVRNDIERAAFELEKAACVSADYILSLTSLDTNRLNELYKINTNKVIPLPICFNNALKFEGFMPSIRCGEKVNCLFIAYLFYDPERVAKRIVEIAPRLQNMCFHIAGAVGNALDRDSLPENVIVYGVIDDEKKREVFSKCNCSLNLTTQTYGMNVKMMEYFSYGIPVLSNEIGTRGYGIKPYEEYIPASFETLENDLRIFHKMSISDRHKIAVKAFNYVCQQHRYENYIPLFENRLGPNGDEATDESDGENESFSYYIFGAGEAGRKCRGELQKRGITCFGFSDNNPLSHGDSRHGLTIYSPEYVLDAVLHDKTLRLVIAVDTPVYLRQMYSQSAKVLPQDKIDIFYHNKLNPSNIDVNKLRHYSKG